MGGFVASLSLSPQASKDESGDDGSSGDDADKDDGASSSGDKEITAVRLNLFNHFVGFIPCQIFL